MKTIYMVDGRFFDTPEAATNYVANEVIDAKSWLRNKLKDNIDALSSGRPAQWEGWEANLRTLEGNKRRSIQEVTVYEVGDIVA